MSDLFVFKLHEVSTYCLMALAIFMYVLHNQLLVWISTEKFQDFHRSQSTKTRWLFIPLMAVEIISGGYLYFFPNVLGSQTVFELSLIAVFMNLMVYVFWVTKTNRILLDRGFSDEVLSSLRRATCFLMIFWIFRATLLAFFV